MQHLEALQFRVMMHVDSSMRRNRKQSPASYRLFCKRVVAISRWPQPRSQFAWMGSSVSEEIGLESCCCTSPPCALTVEGADAMSASARTQLELIGDCTNVMAPSSRLVIMNEPRRQAATLCGFRHVRP